MQQQVHSYSFQLREHSICTSVSSHPLEMSFYSSAILREQPNNSVLCRLDFCQENPRKSVVNSLAVEGTVDSIKPFELGNGECKIFMSTAGEVNCIRILSNDNFNNESLNSSQLDLFYQTQAPIKEILKTKDSSILIALSHQIVLVDPSKPSQTESIVKFQENKEISHAAIDPARGYVTYSIGNEVFVYDRQSKNQKFNFKVSPKQRETITNIDFNPNKQYYLMTGHHDFMKFWDIRKTSIPVKIVEDHHTFLLKALYNPAHDELVLGSYDDGSVGLYRMLSVSSSPSGEGPDALVKLYDQHQDSVHNLCWGHSPWVFASVCKSANNLVVNLVPSVEKYRILL